MTTAIPVQPDIEAHVWAQLEGIPGVTSFCYAALPMPLVPWLVAYSLQVDARASTKQAARDRAEHARAVLWGLAAVPWPDGVVSYVQITEGPWWLPDDDGEPRYVLRVEVRAHPVPGGPVAPMASARAAGTVRKE